MTDKTEGLNQIASENWITNDVLDFISGTPEYNVYAVLHQKKMLSENSQ